MKSFLASTLCIAALGFTACSNAEEVPAVAPEVEAPAYQAAPSGSYQVEKTHAYISFTYDHQGYSRPVLLWRDWDGTLEWNAEDPAASSIAIEIQVASMDSGVEKFNNHLASDDMFATEANPVITFKSTSVEKLSDSTGTITGDLVMKGISKPVTLDVEFHKAGFDKRGKVHKIGFSGTTSILRSEWDLGFATPFVSDEVDISVSAEFIKPE